MKTFFKTFVTAVLEAEAKAVLKKYKPKIVAVTGSVGKTSTKDAIFTVLSRFYFVRKSQKSFNSEIGVPLTILGRPNAWSNPIGWTRNFFEGLMLLVLRSEYPEWLILEVGADRPGDIEKISKWIKPDITVITRMSEIPVHVEFFDSPDDVKKEKSFLAAATKPDGMLILNADDELTRSFGDLSKSKKLTYGFHENADVHASDYGVSNENLGTKFFPTGITYDVRLKGGGIQSDTSSQTAPAPQKCTVAIAGALGKQHAYATLAACAVGVALNKSLKEIASALMSHITPPGRMKIIEGIKGSLIIDDTYNSSPVALNEALDTLKVLDTNTRKIVVLGDMLELGQFSTEEHKKAGAQAARVAAILVTVGVRAKAIALAAREAGLTAEQVFSFDDSDSAGDFLSEKIKEGDVILCKGSQGIRMERIVEKIMAEPSKVTVLLVRQDEEWKLKK